MKKLICAAIAVAPLAFSAPASAQVSPADLEMVRDNWIFVFDRTVTTNAVRGLADRAVAAVGGQRGHVYTHTIHGFSAHMPAEAAARLAASNPNIAYYEADQVARVIGGVGAKKGKPGGGTQPAQTKPYGITRVNGVANYTGSNRAWIIDTGIDLAHPDLNVDAAHGANFSKGNSFDDGNGHGTHVSGTVAALNNTIGVIGVAPGAPVVPVRVLNNAGSGSYADVIAGIDYVGANGQPGDVANMSLGGGFSQAVNDAVIAASANVKFALAAGNESTDANTKSPASANGANIYTVSAMDASDHWASFSNYGNPPVDCADPGVSVFSTYKGQSYATLSGTSMATPHLTGVLLLGPARSSGTVIGDPDGNPDPICVH